MAKPNLATHIYSAMWVNPTKQGYATWCGRRVPGDRTRSFSEWHMAAHKCRTCDRKAQRNYRLQELHSLRRERA